MTKREGEINASLFKRRMAGKVDALFTKNEAEIAGKIYKNRSDTLLTLC